MRIARGGNRACARDTSAKGGVLDRRLRAVASVASATFALASSLASGHETEDAAGPLPLLTPTIVEYRWTFLAPQWIVEARKYDTRVFVPTTRPKRIEYDVLDFEFESRTIGRV